MIMALVAYAIALIAAEDIGLASASGTGSVPWEKAMKRP
jgi:hypothetical protein